MRINTVADVILVGFDTLRPIYGVSCPFPFEDENWVRAMKCRGFTMHLESKQCRLTGEDKNRKKWHFQDPEFETLRLSIYNSRQVVAEFSAPRLKSRSVLNLELASVAEANHLVAWVRERISILLPEAGIVKVEAFRRVDVAADFKAGEDARDVVKLISSAQVAGIRKSETVKYRYQGTVIKGATRSLSIYPKWVELEAHLSPEDLKAHAEDIAKAKKDGRVRVEHRFKPKKAASKDYLEVAARELIKTLEDSFRKGKTVAVSSNKLLIDTVDAFPLTQHQKNELIADALRRSEYGNEYVKTQVSPRTFHRKNTLARQYPVRLTEGAEKIIEVDFRPVINSLKAA